MRWSLTMRTIFAVDDARNSSENERKQREKKLQSSGEKLVKRLIVAQQSPPSSSPPLSNSPRVLCTFESKLIYFRVPTQTLYAEMGKKANREVRGRRSNRDHCSLNKIASFSIRFAFHQPDEGLRTRTEMLCTFILSFLFNELESEIASRYYAFAPKLRDDERGSTMKLQKKKGWRRSHTTRMKREEKLSNGLLVGCLFCAEKKRMKRERATRKNHDREFLCLSQTLRDSQRGCQRWATSNSSFAASFTGRAKCLSRHRFVVVIDATDNDN